MKMKKLINYFQADKRVFAKGLCKEKLFFIFVIGCVFGCIFEELLTIGFQYINNQPIVWVTRRGLIYGELSPVYGFGAVLMAYFLLRKEKRWYENFLYGGLIGGAFEYIASFLQERFTGAVSWNYSDKFLNIHGRTTVPYMLVWGLLALLLVYIVYPFLSKLIEKIPYNLGILLYRVLLVFIMFDLFVSFGAAIRYWFRQLGWHPFSPLGSFFDKFYPDEVMKRVYNNAVFK